MALCQWKNDETHATKPEIAIKIHILTVTDQNRLHPVMVYPMLSKAGGNFPGLWGDSKSGYIHNNDLGKLKTQYHLKKLCAWDTAAYHKPSNRWGVGWVEILSEQVRKHYQMTQKIALTKTFIWGSSRIHFVQDIWSTRKTWEVSFTWTMLSTLYQWNAFSGCLSD